MNRVVFYSIVHTVLVYSIQPTVIVIHYLLCFPYKAHIPVAKVPCLSITSIITCTALLLISFQALSQGAAAIHTLHTIDK